MLSSSELTANQTKKPELPVPASSFFCCVLISAMPAAHLHLIGGIPSQKQRAILHRPDHLFEQAGNCQEPRVAQVRFRFVRFSRKVPEKHRRTQPHIAARNLPTPRGIRTTTVSPPAEDAEKAMLLQIKEDVSRANCVRVWLRACNRAMRHRKLPVKVLRV